MAMVRYDLSGQWNMRKYPDGQWIDAKVPGSVFKDLLNVDVIDDPFYRDNEDRVKRFALYDYQYTKEFCIDDILYNHDKIFLCCEGLDTLCSIDINGRYLADVNNMHRSYEWNIKDFIKEGTNTITIILYSPIEYITNKNKEAPLWGSGDAIAGFPHLRKAHSMFGWDWGPQLPDLGIWKDIYILGYNSARLEDVYISQRHGDDKVDLDIQVDVEKWKDVSFKIYTKIISPDGEIISKEIVTRAEEEHLEVVIEEPELWWPNGYGAQPLYRVEVILSDSTQILDKKEFNIGLRTLTVKREPDEWGESFQFEVNGVSIFAMGANYIPEDSLLSRCSQERTEKLIKDCVKANFNCIRVWGGGSYPHYYFYDLCDKYGLIVWQDFMFACAIYRLTDDFAQNVQREAEDNIRRIRNHACLGLWCGNNEVEVAWTDWSFPKSDELKRDYTKLFEEILPNMVQKYDPNTFYWPSSPSSGGKFEEPNSERMGDVHYWEVWHGLKPFTAYTEHYFRFVSEFGFQSFPDVKTVESFTLPQDRNIFSYTMEKHQKNDEANGKMLYYLSNTFKYPKNFEMLLYATQLLQAEAIRYGVEHWRRNRGRCMGTIYWQLNDCWPVASWSSIDYYGRWKALHYFAKRFFAPILISAEQDAKTVRLHIINETMEDIDGKIIWSLKDNKCNIIKEGYMDVSIDKLSSSQSLTLNFEDELKTICELQRSYLEYAFVNDNRKVSSGTLLFVPPKHFEFLDPYITLDIKEERDEFQIELSCRAFAKYIKIDFAEFDCVLSDNYFDLSKGCTKIVKLAKKNLAGGLNIDDVKDNITINSIYDMA